MKLVSRTHRALALVVGVAILVTLVVQVWRDGRQLRLKGTTIQSITK